MGKHFALAAMLAAVAGASVLVWLLVAVVDRILDPLALRRAWVALVAAVVPAWAVGVVVGLLISLNGVVTGLPLLVIGWVLGLVPTAFWVS